MAEGDVRVKRPYGELIKGCFWGTLAILVVAALLQVLGVDPVLVWILGGILAGCSLLLGVIMYFMSGRMFKELQWLVAGNAWVHWTYDRDEWERFMDQEWRRSRRTVLWLSLIVPAIGLIFFPLGTAGAIGALVVSAAGWALLYYGLQRHYTRQKAVTGVALIGPMGCYLGSTYTSWTGLSGTLRSVQLKEGTPSTVEFEVLTTTAGENPTTTTNTIRVAVPRGHEADAQELVQRFYSGAQN